ncbi:MAG: hypothetical protein MRK02_01975 [Candidatus Scalindua sp.]|nr:hypothetical protein [Candidatus Scalindua sp.]
MKIISVLGTASNVGKTTVALYIIRNLLGSTCNHGGQSWRLADERAKRLGALKITVRHEGVCPRHSTCDSCDAYGEPFKIVTDDDVIMEGGKDTARLSSSGALKVVWLQTDSNVEGVGINTALACFDNYDTLIVEGNSLLRVRDVDVAVLVATPSVKKMKRSARLLLNKIDLVAINIHAEHSLDQIRECKSELGDLYSRGVPFFMINPYKEDTDSNRAFIERIRDFLSD